MPITNVAHRVLQFKGPAAPRFPAQVRVQAELGPKELFGEEELSGRLSNRPPNTKTNMKADLWHGGVRGLPGGRLSKLDASTSFFDLDLRLEGSIATIEGQLSNMQRLEKLVEMVATNLPALLSAALHGPVVVTDVWGDVGDLYFDVEVRGTFRAVWRVLDTPADVMERMALIAKLPTDCTDRVFAAFRYVNQAHWLQYTMHHPGQFASEHLLNLHKAVEVLLPHGGSVDNLRSTLRTLGTVDEVVEVVASLTHVRNQVDVGHCAIEHLDVKQHCDVHRFVLYATEIVHWLIFHVVSRLGDGSFTLPARATVDPSKKRRATLSRLAENLDKINPVRPRTFAKD